MLTRILFKYIWNNTLKDIIHLIQCLLCPCDFKCCCSPSSPPGQLVIPECSEQFTYCFYHYWRTGLESHFEKYCLIWCTECLYSLALSILNSDPVYFSLMPPAYDIPISGFWLLFFLGLCFWPLWFCLPLYDLDVSLELSLLFLFAWSWCCFSCTLILWIWECFLYKIDINLYLS